MWRQDTDLAEQHFSISKKGPAVQQNHGGSTEPWGLPPDSVKQPAQNQLRSEGNQIRLCSHCVGQISEWALQTLSRCPQWSKHHGCCGSSHPAACHPLQNNLRGWSITSTKSAKRRPSTCPASWSETKGSCVVAPAQPWRQQWRWLLSWRKDSAAWSSWPTPPATTHDSCRSSLYCFEMAFLRDFHCSGIFSRSRFLSHKWMCEKGFLIPEAPVEPEPWWGPKHDQLTQTMEALMTFFIYLKVVGGNCQLSPPFSTLLRVTICVLPRSHWDAEGESHRPAPRQGWVCVCLKQPFHLQALSPAYIQAGSQEEKGPCAPATHLPAASAPANPVFTSLVISCLLVAKAQLSAVVPLARGGPSTERLIVPGPGWAH